MKYQIYLNKETSAFVNLFASQNNMKPSTVIKQIVEETYKKAFDYARSHLEKEEKAV